jgi:predicted transcriptional regulator
VESINQSGILNTYNTPKEESTMSQTLLEMAKELVTEQIRVHQLSPEDAKSLLMHTHATLLSMNQVEIPGSVTVGLAPPREGARGDWKRSIAKHSITCLECGSSFRQLSARHLRVHDLDPNTYRTKYGIPSTQALSSREATARRRELAQQIRPWEAAASKRASAHAEASTNGKRR